MARLRSPGRLVLCLVLSGAAMPAWSQGLSQTSAQALWRDVAGGGIAVSGALLERLQPGRIVTTALPQGSQRWRITGAQDFVNGDRSLRAGALQGSDRLTLTWSATALFVTLERPDAVWRAHATRAEPGAPYLGQLSETGELPAHAARPDYVVPRRPDAVSPRSADLLIGGAGIAAVSARQAAAADNGLSIDQRFGSPAVVAGQRMTTTLTVTVTNRAPFNRRLPDLDLYFLLEDLEVLGQPGDCHRRSVRGQPVMRCALPGILAGGASRRFVFPVSTAPVSAAGTRLWSSALIGDLRHDASVNVVRDVLPGPNGLPSELNAALLDRTDTDPRGDAMIDVLALYTSGADSLYEGGVETRINQLFSIANRIYRDSGVKINLRPVRHQFLDYSDERSMEDMLADLESGGDQFESLRAEWGADLVVLFRSLGQENGRCGLANLGGYQTAGDLTSFNDRDYAFSIIALDCPVDSVLAHEVGHNMGLTHSHDEDGEGGTFPWATGHGVDERFVTVMADPAFFGGAPRLSLFSSPDLDCDGVPCGVAHRAGEGADAVRALNAVRFQVANYYPTRVPPLSVRRVTTDDGAATQSRITLAASVENGRRVIQEAGTTDRLDINAEFFVEDAHIGRAADFHVVVATPDGYLQLLDGGAHLKDWDGNTATLEPFSGTEALGDRESLVAVEQFQPSPDLIGSELAVYVAYRLRDSGRLVFTEEPLRLRIR